MFATKNLVDMALKSVVPWEFRPTETLTDVLRNDKTARQNWYRNKNTDHQFYTFIEPQNPSIRPSKQNQPRLLHGLSVDYDLPLTPERVQAAIQKMTHAPTWIEKSLGGNVRLVWVFEAPLPVSGYDFCLFMLQALRKPFRLDLLPGMDEAAFEAPERLLCNGCEWAPGGGGKVPESLTRSLLVDRARVFQFKEDAGGPEIPLDVVEAALKERYPSFTWPSDFLPETQGPSFWIPDSTSPMSSILKANGMFSFSAHADKPFWSWADLLGKEFVAKFDAERVSEATKDAFFDGRLYWRKLAGERFVCENKDDFKSHLIIDNRMPTKADKTGTSPVDRAMQFIRNEARIDGAAPILFYPKGVIRFNGMRLLNTAEDCITRPAESPTVWGSEGGFPFISSVLGSLFDPEEQTESFLAWLRHFYSSALAGKPSAGQNIFIAGGTGIGKTVTAREIIGGLVGGYADARDFMMGEESFGADLFRHPLWCLDDETMTDSEANRSKFASYIKKMAANQAFRYHKKFETPVMIPWMGRITITLNLDYTSSRVLVPLDDSSFEKISFFRGHDGLTKRITFPSRWIIGELLQKELPYLGRWLVDWEPPARLLGDARYGTLAYHEDSLLSKAKQGSKTAPFTEILLDFLTKFFTENPKAEEWSGTITWLVRSLHADPLNEAVLRALRLEQVNRYLESVQKEGNIVCSATNGPRQTRIWKFPRFDPSEGSVNPTSGITLA